MSIDEIQQIIHQIIKNLPKEFTSKMENVDILVDDWPTLDELQSIRAHKHSLVFGLYQGIPKTKRGNYYSGVMPDKITIFAGPILLVSKKKQEARKRIKDTVLHEIGHHFGLTDEQIYNAQNS